MPIVPIRDLIAALDEDELGRFRYEMFRIQEDPETLDEERDDLCKLALIELLSPYYR